MLTGDSIVKEESLRGSVFHKQGRDKLHFFVKYVGWIPRKKKKSDGVE